MNNNMQALPKPHADSAVPRGPLLAAGALALATLLAVTLVRITGIGAMQVPDAAEVMVRELRFEDRADGTIVIMDAGNGRLVQTVAAESNGFLRGTMRGLARERKRQGIGAQPAFRLIGRADGRLTLIDPATGRRVDLESFGPPNVSAFAKLMQAPAITRAP